MSGSVDRPLLEVRDLAVHFPFARGWPWNRTRGAVRAVRRRHSSPPRPVPMTDMRGANIYQCSES